ncbi:unnamed protein product, partial [Arabidopsis halleri]
QILLKIFRSSLLSLLISVSTLLGNLELISFFLFLILKIQRNYCMSHGENEYLINTII